MTSPTVCNFSASSSGTSTPNSSSKAITNSTMSSESAPKSSMNDASGVTCSGLTPSCSTMMSLTFSSIDLSAIKFGWVAAQGLLHARAHRKQKNWSFLSGCFSPDQGCQAGSSLPFISNPKFEYRNPKQAPNDQNQD